MKLGEIFLTEEKITEPQLKLAFDKVKSAGKMSLSDVKSLGKELADQVDFGRTPGSAQFVLGRFHVLVHGEAPSEMTERSAEKMLAPTAEMTAYAKSRGIDVGDQIKRARVELAGRAVKIKQPEATKAMSDYYKANKADLPKDITSKRSELVGDIMAGMSVADAFKKHS